MKENDCKNFAGAPTLFVKSASGIRYAYRRFGSESAPPLLFLQHFMGTMDNWDPAITDPLSESHPVILFDNAGIGRSEGKTPDTVRAMAAHVLAGTGPEGGENMSMLKPELLPILQSPDWNSRVRKLFFSPTTTSQAAGRAFQERQATRTTDTEPMSGEAVFSAQAAAIAIYPDSGHGSLFQYHSAFQQMVAEFLET
jgi:hypothetical protein